MKISKFLNKKILSIIAIFLFIGLNIQAEDIDTYAGGIPQNVTLDVSGGQFSSDFINPNL